ncbi:hypothetical protein [Halalkalibacterium ligniniphilum]|uniref:hypothetical protein n=1 Tax=Halalkalibacterium ligniniphilum TaxID=1134413 RepID=UPI00034D236B|nr:hypothetical protein [Halalkalibacterium ligniniphilum]
MGDWNKQASRNNNIQPDLSFKKEELADKKIQFNVQEQNGIETMGRVEKEVKQQGDQ